jgi:O-antigen/teichoic acid export membrane protein
MDLPRFIWVLLCELANPFADPHGFIMIAWLIRNRTSVRFAFILRLATMVMGTLSSLIWTRLIIHALGSELYGLFISFTTFISLGGLSELGMGGVISLRTSQYLGAGRMDELKIWLANARTVFFLLAVGAATLCLVLVPVLPGWLRFTPLPAAGSLPVLFALGSFGLFLMIISSYFNSLNYACGTLTWPILPSFLFLQATFLTQWLLATNHAPLYLIYLPNVIAGSLNTVLSVFFLRSSYPTLANFSPLRFHLPTALSLFSMTGWVFLCSMGNVIYTTTDRLLINAGFGPGRVTTYQLNYKLCELAVPTVAMLSFLVMPKLTQLIASADESDRAKVVSHFLKLNQIQTFLGCASAMGYLLINDLFIRLWIGSEQQAPLLWQFAFACNLAVTVSGDAVIQVAGRCGSQGIRVAGLAIGSTALLNLVLSFVFMTRGSIAGIALATVLAQMILIYILGKFTLGYLSIPRRPFFIKSLAFPLAMVTAFHVIHLHFQVTSPTLWIAYLTALFIIARVLDINLNLLKEEARLFRNSFFR